MNIFIKKSIKNLHILLLFTFVVASCNNNSVENIVSSPSGKITIAFSINEGIATYSVAKEGKTIIKPSSLGFKLKDSDLFNCQWKIKKVTSSFFDETWEQPWGEEIFVRNCFNEMLVELQEQQNPKRFLNIVFRAFDDGIGFRYIFPEQEHLKDFEIIDEKTEFAFAEDHQSWSIPAYKGEYYECLYEKSILSQKDTVCTPLTMETSDGNYITIHEANLTDYAAMNLHPVNGTSKLKTDLTPWSTGVKVYAKTPFHTPWRTVIIAEDLNALANSCLMLNLNEPCKIDDTSWLRPSKYIGIMWGMHIGENSWSQGPKHGATTKNTIKYIDFAAANNIKCVLVEGWNEGWDGNWSANGLIFNFTKAYPDFDLDKIVAYASSKGVKLIGHHETAGSTINYENQMEEAFSFCKKHGIDVVKTGYVSRLLDKKERHSSQYGVRHYRKVIETAAKYKIMIDNHEPVMPTGLQRTYPNLMNQEGVRAQEYDAWSRDGGSPPEHTTVVPFTRGLAGPMDFYFGTFNLEKTAHPSTRVQTTLTKQLALYVVIYSPFQMASDLPENYENNPAFEFIKAVPVDWEKSIIKDGKIGDFIVTARKDKNSEDWYVGAITDENSRNLNIDLSFLDEGKTYKAKLFKDGVNADWKSNPYSMEIEEMEVNSKSILKLFLAPGGGTAIIIRPNNSDF